MNATTTTPIRIAGPGIVWLDGRPMSRAELDAVHPAARDFLARSYRRTPATHAHLTAPDSVRCWNVNDAVIPVANFPAGVDVPAGQAAAEALQSRIWDVANAAERFGFALAALRAEHGPGHAVLKIETGRIYRT